MDGYCSSAKLFFSLFLPMPAVVSVFFNTGVQQKQCNCPNNNSSHPFSSQHVWQGRQDAMGKLLWVLLSFLLCLYRFQSLSIFLPSHQVHLSRAKWKTGFSFFFLWTRVCFKILPILTQTLTFLKKDKMCCPGCPHLPDKIPGTPGKLPVHANYSLLGMCLEYVFELNPFFLFRILKFSQVKWSNQRTGVTQCLLPDH